MKKFALLFCYLLFLVGCIAFYFVVTAPSRTVGQTDYFPLWFALWLGCGGIGFSGAVYLEPVAWPELREWLWQTLRRITFWQQATEMSKAENRRNDFACLP